MSQHEVEYLAVKDDTDLCSISYEDFGYLSEADISELCSGLPFNKRAKIKKLWATHPARTQADATRSSTLLEVLGRFAEIVKQQNRPLLHAVNALCSAQPMSTVSDRDRHQKNFKEKLRDRYQCKNPENPHITKCMILGQFFSTNDVMAPHIVGLHERNICPTLGFDDVWDERNGILLFHEIDKRFKSMELTFLPNPDDHTIRLKVLYDNILDKQLSINRSTIGIRGSGNVTFGDLHDKLLQFPPLTFPFRRALARHAKSAYYFALRSHAPHTIASSSAPSEDEWEALWNYCKVTSPDCSETAYFSD